MPAANIAWRLKICEGRTRRALTNVGSGDFACSATRTQKETRRGMREELGVELASAGERDCGSPRFTSIYDSVSF